MKKIIVASTDSMMYLFLMHHVSFLTMRGFQVDIVISLIPELKSENYLKKIKQFIPSSSKIYPIYASRRPLSFKNLIAFIKLALLSFKGKYDILWSNEPVMGFLSRISFFLFSKSKIVYMCHGFHFFKNGPLINYLIYPVELFLSLITDTIICINKIDYDFSKSFLFGNKYKIDGIGFNRDKYLNNCKKEKYKNEFGFRETDLILISVGELNTNKNHIEIIKALQILDLKDIIYLICGVGPNDYFLREFVNKNNLKKNVFLLGQRYDIPHLLKYCDVFIHPSYREGLGIAPLEAMASGLPIITSDRHGINDYSKNHITGFKCAPDDVKSFCKHIKYFYDNPKKCKQIGKSNISRTHRFSFSIVSRDVESIINKILA